MKTIEIAVKDKIATAADGALYICGNSDYVVDFHFDSEWDAYDTKTARFVYNGTYQDQVFQGTQCPVPAIVGARGIAVGVFAGNMSTTTPAYISARRSILCDSGVPADPAPDVYAQIMELIQGLGEPDPENIAAAVADYIRNNPISETDPTVPDWAKASEKPSYTAAEVGAISQGDLQAATDATLCQAKESGLFDGATGADGKSAYQYAQDGGYTGTEAEFAAKLAEEMPDKLPNPNALTFTGAVSGTYDGSEPMSVEIPSGGTGGSSEENQWRLLNTVTLTEPVSAIEILSDSDGNPFKISEFVVFSPLGVVCSGNSQLLIHAIEPGAEFDDLQQTYYWKQISTTANGFLATNSKSILVKSDWVGGRYTVCTSGTYDVNGIALPVGTVRFSSGSMKDIGGVKLSTQYGSITINEGTFYLYGR